MKVITVEIKGCDPITSTEKTLYFSQKSLAPLHNSDADRPNQYYDPRISELSDISRFMFGPSRTYGQSQLGSGTIELINADDQLSYLLDWGFDGRSIEIYEAEEFQPFNQFIKKLKGTLDAPQLIFSESSPSSLIFRIMDRQKEFQVNVQDNLYLGTNGTGGGYGPLEENEGTPSDIKGQPKPLCFGECFNVSAVVINAALLKYQVHDGPIQDVTACYDKGVALAKDLTGTPGAGEYYIDITTGILILGSKPDNGQITCDVQGHKLTSYYTSTADLISEIASVYGGLTSAEIDASDVTALNLANSAVVGLYTDTSQSVKSVLDELANSIGAYWQFDRLGSLRMGRFAAPIGTPIATFQETDLIGIAKNQSSDREKGIPVYRVALSHTKNYTVQSSDSLAGSVTEARRAYLERQYRSTTAEDSSVLVKHLLSPEMEKNTLLTTESDATTEATRLLNLYKVRRDFFSITVENNAQNRSIDLGDIINITLQKLGLQSGKNFIVIGLADFSPDLNKIQIECWG